MTGIVAANLTRKKKLSNELPFLASKTTAPIQKLAPKATP
jgi:hypothetical protein